MEKLKKFMKMLGAYLWQFFKSSFPVSMMYFCAGTILMMLGMKNNADMVWNNKVLLWTIVCSAAGVVYNALAMWGIGGGHYEMLVTGNVKRMSVSEIEGGYKMSRHKLVQEYRPWKGFVIGAYCGFFMIFFGLLFGFNQAKVNVENPSRFIGSMLLISFLLTGCSILPLYALNQSGVYVSYFWSCAFAIIPIVVSGAFYIIGAYSKRNKRVREQLIADKMAEKEAQKEKKINYGGLPGTKPKKRK